VRLTEMPRKQGEVLLLRRGGARMWMEETIVTRINETRTDEALSTEPDLVTAPPLLHRDAHDGVATRKQQARPPGTSGTEDVGDDVRGPASLRTQKRVAAA